jgi:hypothetical protein
VNASLKAANFATMWSGSTITTVVMWNPATGLYTTHIIGIPMNNFALVAGSGYWIFVGGSGSLTYNP